MRQGLCTMLAPVVPVRTHRNDGTYNCACVSACFFLRGMFSLSFYSIFPIQIATCIDALLAATFENLLFPMSGPTCGRAKPV